MPITLTQTTTVLPGHRIEFTAPQLPEGAQVNVQITLPTESEGAVSTNRTAELFAQWAEEDAKMTPEEIAAEDAAYAAMEANWHERRLAFRVPTE